MSLRQAPLQEVNHEAKSAQRHHRPDMNRGPSGATCFPSQGHPGGPRFQTDPLPGINMVDSNQRWSDEMLQ